MSPPPLDPHMLARFFCISFAFYAIVMIGVHLISRTDIILIAGVNFVWPNYSRHNVMPVFGK